MTAVATALFVGVATAAGLGSAVDGRLAVGSASVGRCDDAVTVAFTTSGAALTSVTVEGVAAGCAGASLSYTLVDALGARVGASNGSAVVPAGGGSVALAVASPQPAAAGVAHVRVLVVEP